MRRSQQAEGEAGSKPELSSYLSSSLKVSGRFHEYTRPKPELSSYLDLHAPSPSARALILLLPLAVRHPINMFTNLLVFELKAASFRLSSVPL